MEFEAEPVSDTRLTLTIRANDETRASYPFDFKFGLIYELSGDTLRVIYRVANRGGADMPFGLGGHPGFNVPLAPGLRFEDYRLEFAGALRASAGAALAQVLHLRRGGALRARK